jgi:hypothetical protein
MSTFHPLRTFDASYGTSEDSEPLCAQRRCRVPKFVTIGYGDEAGYNRTAQAVRNAAHAHDRELLKRGALIGLAKGPTQVRNPDSEGVQTESAPFMSSPLPVAGFAIIEAADLAEAVNMVAQSPCAVAHGVVEVWPLEQPIL